MNEKPSSSSRRSPEWSFYLQEGTTVQTLILDKDRFESLGAASKWVRNHNFSATKVDETSGSFRYRQRDPSDFRRGSFRTISISEGVKAVIGRLQDVTASQSSLFPETISFFGDVGSIAMSEDSASTSWVQVFTLGKFIHPQGEFNVDDGFLENIVNSFEGMKSRGAEIPVDYEHGSAMPGATPEAARAAGWVEEVDHRPGSGLWARVEWTDDAVDFIRSREYRFISPEFHPDYTDELGSNHGPTLLAVGLVNRPHLKGMEAVSLKESRNMQNETNEPTVDPVANAVKREIVEYDNSVQAAEVPGQGEDLAELVKHAFDRLDALEDRLKELHAGELGKGVEVEAEEKTDDPMYSMKETAIPEEVTALLGEMSDRLQRIERENNDLKSERDAIAAKADLDLAFRQGRITRAQFEPLMSLRLKDKGAFEAIVAATPEGTVANSEKEHGVYGDRPSEDGGTDLIATIKAKAEQDGTTFAKAYKSVVQNNPELVAAHARETRNTNGHVGRIIGGN